MSTPTEIAAHDLMRYELIGQGAYSKVYRGSWRGEPIAIKVLNPLDGEGQQSFEREIALLHGLDHPNVIRLHGVASEAHTLALDYLPKGSLFHCIERGEMAQWTFEQKVTLWTGIAKGLEYLHSKKIIHRDLKSSNVLLTDALEAVITDLGIARLYTGTGPLTGRLGTVAWMAPEQMQEAGSYDEKVDIYALGMIIWEVVSERAPFADKSEEQILCRKVMEKKGEKIKKSTPVEIAALIKACWAEAALRPSAAEVIVQLEALPPPSTPLPPLVAALKKKYTALCADLPLPMSEETFPLKELFTQLVMMEHRVVEKKEKEQLERAYLDPTLPERDSLSEAMFRLQETTEPIEMEDLFAGKGSASTPKKVLLIGRAGIGKTTLIDRLTLGWTEDEMFSQFEALFRLPLRQLADLQVDEGDPLKWLSAAIAECVLGKGTKQNEVYHFLTQNSDKVLLLLDGLDEAAPHLLPKIEALLREDDLHILLSSP